MGQSRNRDAERGTGFVLIRVVPETGSTNDDVAALAREGALEGIWVRAERQSGGRGRQGRSWVSPPGNLHASTLVRVQPEDPPAPTLALVAAVALHEVLVIRAPSIRIKWPNDLVAAGAKVAGILLERQGDAVIVGFGVNLSFHPEGVSKPTTSVTALSGIEIEAEAMAELLAGNFARWRDRWRMEGLAPVREAWLDAAHPIGTPLSTPDGEGLFDGLDDTGALRLLLPGGAVCVIHAGDVFLI